MKQFLDYLRYSGLSVSFTLNPFHWHYMPRIFVREKDPWDVPSGAFSFLFLTIRVWIDDGSW